MTEQDLDMEEELRSRIRPGKKFEFDPDRMLFVLTTGDSQSFFDLSQTDDMATSFGVGDGDEKEGLIISLLGVAQSASLRQKLAELTKHPKKLKAVTQRTTQVMRAVFTTMAPDIELPEDSGKDHFSFSAYIDGSGKFIVRTFGNCSCFVIDPYSHAVTPDFMDDAHINPSTPIGYGPHNNDMPAKTYSLLAGAGTLSWLAEERISDQLNLGLIRK